MRRSVLILAYTSLWAQTQPAFEVASVRPQPWEGTGRVGVFVQGGTLSGEHACLYSLVEFAYDVKPDHLSGGPSWAKCGALDSSDMYQVVAKSSGTPPPPMSQFRTMLQALLADRFQLKIHHVQKELPIFNLVIAPRGFKLKENAAEAPFALHQDARLNQGKAMRITATHASMEKLRPIFEHLSGRPLIDQTGLTGFYDFEIEFDHDTSAADTVSPDSIGQTFAIDLCYWIGCKIHATRFGAYLSMS